MFQNLAFCSSSLFFMLIINNKKRRGRWEVAVSRQEAYLLFSGCFMPRISFLGSLQTHPALLKWPLHVIIKELLEKIHDTKYISQKQMPPHHVNVSRQILWKECWWAKSSPVAPQHKMCFESSSHVCLFFKDSNTFFCLVWIFPGV